MSTVKIKTEPTAAAAATAAVDVKVKLEPSLSTSDIKLELHTSDTDTKIESDSEADSDEDIIKSEDDDDNDEDTDQDQFTITPKGQQQYICDHSGCGRNFNSTKSLRRHQREHRFQTELYILGKTYTLTRQSLSDRWPCPISDCEMTCKTVVAFCCHIQRCHGDTNKQQWQEEQQPPVKKTRPKHYYHDVDDFYVNGNRCGYHSTIGVFICHECRLVPECLLTHMQQIHGCSEKSIGSSVMPDSAVTANADPSVNQHTSNPLLTSAISQPCQWRHRDIVQGWLCVTSDCGYCGYTAMNRSDHKRYNHQSEHITTVPALVLRLVFVKTNANYFLIARIDLASSANTNSNTRLDRHKLDYSDNELNTQDEIEDDADQSETTEVSNQKRQYICDDNNCGRFFTSSDQLCWHRREHKLEIVTIIQDKPYILTRLSLDDRWPCPISGCETTFRTTSTIREHIVNIHSTAIKHKRGIIENDNNQQQQHIIKKKKHTINYLNVEAFYISGARCSYHNTIGVFICHECKLVPECLLTHLQQKHGYNEKSADNATLPESAVNASADPNINQHTSNPHLAAAIRQPTLQQHRDIVQGWLCITSDCGYCGYTIYNKSDHKKHIHKGEPFSTVPALILRLSISKSRSSCFLITRLDTTTNSIEPVISTNQYKSECVDDDDGDELVLSDYSD